MSHYYGTVSVPGRRPATRGGTIKTGLGVTAATHDGAIRVQLHHDQSSGRDRVTIEKIPWQGSGDHSILYKGWMQPSKESKDEKEQVGM